MDREPIPPIKAGQHVQGGQMTFAINTVNAAEGRIIVLRVEAQNGSFMFPITPDTAIQIGADLREHGRNAKSGLHVPPQLDL